MDTLVEKALKEILSLLGASYTAIKKEEVAGQMVFSIETDDAKTLIGAHGDTVHALDMLVKKIVEKRFDDAHRKETGSTDIGPLAPSRVEGLFLVDVNGYRAQKIRDLQTKALMMAERARSFQYDVELEPMSAYERLIVHSSLSGSPNVKTESQGEGRGRRVVIRYVAEKEV